MAGLKTGTLNKLYLTYQQTYPQKIGINTMTELIQNWIRDRIC